MESSKRKTITGTRFLSFNLAGEEYCMEILSIREILGMPDVTPVPQTPDYIRGVMNLRGNIVPVINLRLKFHMDSLQQNDRTCIIVVEIPSNDEKPMLMGIIVDTIHEVIAIPEDKINRIPYINTRIHASYIQGFSEIDGKIRILLDIQKILSQDDLSDIQELEHAKTTEEQRS